MNDTTWQKLYKDSLQLTKPTLSKQLITKDDITEMHQLIGQVIKSFLQKGDLHLGLKVYINKELRNDMIDRMVDDPPSLDLSLESWSKKIFKEEKFGIIFHGLEEHSNPFAEKAAAIAHPLLKLAGLPLGGLSFLFFMGNYGFTPFGVHKEARGEEGILFHLGPGTKQFYTWDDPNYNVMEHNKKVFHDFEKMLPEAKRYDLESGDAMFIPHQVYHIGNTDEFSLSLTMDYINPPNALLENELLTAAGKEEVYHYNSYQQPVKMDLPISELKQVLDHQSLQEKIDVSLRRKILTLKSNGGLSKKAIRSLQTLIPNGLFSIKGKNIFPLYLEENTRHNALIFARGHRIYTKYHPGLFRLISSLNDGKSLSLELMREVLEPSWEMPDIYGLIGNLLQIEAVDLE